MIRVGVAGAGAIGSAVCRALIDGIDGFSLSAVSDLAPDQARRLIDRPQINPSFVPLEQIHEHADWVVEALPVAAVPALARSVLGSGKTMVMVTSSALLIHPELRLLTSGGGRILVPSGALAGIDGIAALSARGFKTVRLVTTKPPKAYANAPYVVQQKIDLSAIAERTRIFAGHALQAAAAFPANVNVAATLTLASALPPEQVEVEVWADPALSSNCHDILAESDFSTLRFQVENRPDPANPKSSALTALSVISLLRRQSSPFYLG